MQGEGLSVAETLLVASIPAAIALLGGAQEEEADWLAGEILIPYDGALRLARANATDQHAAATFNVSLAVARWRMNHSGARRVAERIRSKAMSS